MSSYAEKMKDYSKVLKKRMIMARLIGILGCAVAITCIVLYAQHHDQTQWQWLCLILMTYSLGTIFLQNCNLQTIKVGNPWQRVNAVCAVLLYAVDVVLITYALCMRFIVLW